MFNYLFECYQSLYWEQFTGVSVRKNLIQSAFLLCYLPKWLCKSYLTFDCISFNFWRVTIVHQAFTAATVRALAFDLCTRFSAQYCYCDQVKTDAIILSLLAIGPIAHSLALKKKTAVWLQGTFYDEIMEDGLLEIETLLMSSLYFFHRRLLVAFSILFSTFGF